MNEREHQIFEKYRHQGFAYLRRGWPDFAFYRKGRNGLEVRFVEVKKPRQKGTHHQQRMLALLEYLGLNVEIERV